jgi:uncharacterized protein (DUF427 family)
MTSSSHGPHSHQRASSGFLSIELGDAPLPDAAWAIETPHDANADLKNHLAFYSEFDGGAQLRID